MADAYFNLPLNLPHAATLARRLAYHVDRVVAVHKGLPSGERVGLEIQVRELAELMEPYFAAQDNPSDDEAQQIVKQAATRARSLVAGIARLKMGDDRLGQAVRNFFECLALGQEGAEQGLRAGENPDSALRP